MEDNVEVYAKCPHCQCGLEYQDHLGMDFDDIYIFVNWSVFCPNCQRTFVIAEDYKMVERRFVE